MTWNGPFAAVRFFSRLHQKSQNTFSKGGSVSSQTVAIIVRSLLSIVIILIGRYDPAAAQSKHPKPEACLVQFSNSNNNYQQLLGGPPQTVSMESGVVALLPSKSVGKHSTKNYEEVLVIFSGRGEMRITGGATLILKKDIIAYCPPNTEHDVINTGREPLRYLYVAAKRGH